MQWVASHPIVLVDHYGSGWPHTAHHLRFGLWNRSSCFSYLQYPPHIRPHARILQPKLVCCGKACLCTLVLLQQSTGNLDHAACSNRNSTCVILLVYDCESKCSDAADACRYYRTRPGSPLWGDSDTGPAADAPAGATAAAKQHQQTKTRTASEVQNSSLQQSTQQHPAIYQEHSAEQQAAEQQAHQDRPPALQGDAGPAAAVAHAAAAHQGVGQESAAAATSAAAFASGMDDATGLGGVPPFWAPLPPKLPRTILTWIWPLIRMPEASLIDAAGLDVAMLLRFIRFCELQARMLHGFACVPCSS